MQEHHATISGVTYNMEEPFFVLATQNPIEQDGTYPLPEAQMDRFMFKVSMDFPSVEELGDIVNLTQASMEENATQVIDGPAILKMRDLARDVPCIKEVIDYAMHLVHSTHPELEDAGEVAKKYIRYGASPRAGQALITGAKIRALIHGNYNVSFEDVDALAFPVLRHRIKINYNAINEGLSIDKTIDLLIKENAKYR
jgi:MoxR-like ATPase